MNAKELFRQWPEKVLALLEEVSCYGVYDAPAMFEAHGLPCPDEFLHSHTYRSGKGKETITRRDGTVGDVRGLDGECVLMAFAGVAGAPFFGRGKRERFYKEEIQKRHAEFSAGKDR